MKKTYFLSIIMLFMIACSSIEKDAKKQMESTFKEIAKDPSSVKLTNTNIVFSNDSLCIIHVDCSAKNGIGTEIKRTCEYIFIKSNKKSYESYQEINNDNEYIFIDSKQYNKNKIGKIYENLPYEIGLRYLAAIHVNKHGNEIGSKDKQYFSIPVPTGTGLWKLNSYRNTFGEEDDEKYLSLEGAGIFSNSATTNSRMTALLFIDKDYNFSFRLIEYDSHIVKTDDIYNYKIKDATDKIHEITLYNNNQSGQMSPSLWYSTTQKKEIINNVLNNEGIITISVKEENSYYTPSTYLFKLDITGFKKAMSYLQNPDIKNN